MCSHLIELLSNFIYSILGCRKTVRNYTLVHFVLAVIILFSTFDYRLKKSLTLTEIPNNS